MSYNSDTGSSRFSDDCHIASSFFVKVLYIEDLPYSAITYSGTCINLKLLRRGGCSHPRVEVRDEACEPSSESVSIIESDWVVFEASGNFTYLIEQDLSEI